MYHKSLEEIYEEFAECLKKVAEHTIGDIVAEYLPYAEIDYDKNTYSRMGGIFIQKV